MDAKQQFWSGLRAQFIVFPTSPWLPVNFFSEQVFPGTPFLKGVSQRRCISNSDQTEEGSLISLVSLVYIHYEDIIEIQMSISPVEKFSQVQGMLINTMGLLPFLSLF